LKISRFLIWLGIVITIVGIVGNLFSLSTVFRFGPSHVVGFNFTSVFMMVTDSLFQGGVLIGLGKIIEIMQKKK
jgi:hypothetical protein